MRYTITNQKDRQMNEEGEHGYEKAVHYHQYYDEGDVHVDLRHVYDLLRSFFRCVLHSRSKPLYRLTLAESQSLTAGRLYRSLPVYVFVRQEKSHGKLF